MGPLYGVDDVFVIEILKQRGEYFLVEITAQLLEEVHQVKEPHKILHAAGGHLGLGVLREVQSAVWLERGATEDLLNHRSEP